MLSTETEPTIEDYPIDAPSAGPTAWARPLNLGTPVHESYTGRLISEVGRLRPWAAERGLAHSVGPSAEGAALVCPSLGLERAQLGRFAERSRIRALNWGTL